jgi:hypothetical protein
MEDSEDKGISITLGVLALSAIVLLGGHMKTVSFEKSVLEKQLVGLAERVTASKTARKQLDEAFEQREQQIKRAAATEALYAGLLTDLLELAKVDPDARLVVQKWKIQSSDATSNDPAAAPAPAEPKESKVHKGAPPAGESSPAKHK